MSTKKDLGNPLGDYRDPSKQKRKNARIRINNLIANFKISGVPKEYECQILDIGTGGLGLSTTTLLYPGDKIQLNFFLDGVEFHINATVSRVSGKIVGVVFDEISSNEVAKIQNYIHSRLFKEK